MTYELKLGAQPLNPSLGPQSLTDLESEIGLSFPEDYRDFVLKWNGVGFASSYSLDDDVVFIIYSLEARPSKILSPLNATREQLWELDGSIHPIHQLIGITEEMLSNLHAYQHSNAFFDWCPKRFWPIGANDMGDRICISLDAPDRGEVFYWSRPDEPLETKGHWGDMPFLYWVAPTFYSFWSTLALMSWEQQEELEG